MNTTSARPDETSADCYNEYKKFASGLGWIQGNGYWVEFMNLCEEWTSGHTSWHLATNLPRALTKDCAQAIAAGWVVGDGGRFYHPDRPGRTPGGAQGQPGSFVTECLPFPRTYSYLGNLPPEREPGAYLGYSYASMSENPGRYWHPAYVPIED